MVLMSNNVNHVQWVMCFNSGHVLFFFLLLLKLDLSWPSRVNSLTWSQWIQKQISPFMCHLHNSCCIENSVIDKFCRGYPELTFEVYLVTLKYPSENPRKAQTFGNISHLMDDKASQWNSSINV
ncbi:hypothetical protein Dimus_031874 [Dionaea muscipula]